MADISKIQIESGTYNIKDEVARNKINGIFENVTEMKNSDKLANGYIVKTLGFYSSEDGGSSYYLIRELKENEVADEHFIISVSNNLVAELLILNNTIHSKQVGLKGDNLTDETTLLQAFFDYKPLLLNKIIDKGIYLITNALYLKTKWRQDGANNSSYQNGRIKIIFDDATLHFNSSVNYGIIMYNMFNTTIDGLSISEEGTKNKICIQGCWNTEFKNMSIAGLDLDTDPNIIGQRETATYSIQHIKFNNVILRHGKITINPYSEDSHYINAVTFNNLIASCYNNEECVLLKKTFSKQQIKFVNSDLSYSTLCIFNVEERQVNPWVRNGISSCSIICNNCYFDSNVPVFKNNIHNNIRYIEIDSRYSGALDQLDIQTMEEYLSTTKLGMSTNYNKNQLPISNLNLTTNGDISSHSYENSNANNLFGVSSTNVTKSYNANNTSKNGYCRRLTFNTTDNVTLTVNGRPYPYTAPATFGMLFEFVSGKASIQISINGSSGTRQYMKIDKSKLKDGINFISCCKNSQIFTKGNWSDVELQFSDLEQNTVIDIHEVGVQQGELYLLNAPLIFDARPTT